MPVRSYIAIPAPGLKEEMTSSIDCIPGCETSPADNHDVVVVITETSTDKEDKVLVEKLNNLESLHMLTLVAAFAE